MSEENTSSSTQSATPTVDTGAMPTTNTSGSATPPKSTTPTLEDVLRENDELKRSQTNAKEELERHRKKLTTYEKQEQERQAAEQAAKDAQLSEIERVTKEHQKAQQQIQQYKQQLILEKVINAAQKKSIVDPELAAMAIEKSLELGDDGMPANLDKVLDDLIKNKPYLVKAAEPTPTPAQTAPTQQTPAIPAMNPGRSSIPGPGNNPTGRPTTLADIPWKR